MSIIQGGFGVPDNPTYQISNSVRIRSDVSAYFNKALVTPTSSRICTFNFCVKRSILGESTLFTHNYSGSGGTQCYGTIKFTSSDTLSISETTNNVDVWNVTTTNVFRDTSAWFLINIIIDTTQAQTAHYAADSRVRVTVNAIQSPTSGTLPTQNYDMLRFNAAGNARIGAGDSGGSYSKGFEGYLSDVYFIDGQAKPYTDFIAADSNNIWAPKVYSGTYGINGFFLEFKIPGSTATYATLGKDTSGTNIITGVTGTIGSTTLVTAITGTVSPKVGQIVTGSGIPANTYATVVGGSSGAWTCTLSQASTNGSGISLTFTGNNWNPNNISVTAGATYDSMIDTPTNVYATLNTLIKVSTTPANYGTLSQGNLKHAEPGSGTGAYMSSIAIPITGKWYWEVTLDVLMPTHAFYPITGLWDTTEVFLGTLPGYSTNGFGYYAQGTYYLNKNTAPNTGTSCSAGSTRGFAYDAATGKLWTRINSGAWENSGDPVAGTNPRATLTPLVPYFACVCNYQSTATVNFGQRPFVSAAPAGFNTLCTANLPPPIIVKPSDYFNARIRTGTGSSYSVTGRTFQPSLVWSKGRSGATSHAIYDAIRGVQKDLGSDLPTDQTTEAQGVTSFNADGYTGGTLAKLNTNSATYIDWMWKLDATAGIDIVAVTGNGSARSINHSLNAVPAMIIGKSITTAGADTGWPVYHKSLANTEYLKLDSTAIKVGSATTYWNSSTPTSSTFSLGTAADVNNNGDNYIYYLFAEIEGYSKFGSYKGNSSTDGPFIHCNFSPRWVLIKDITSVSDWRVYDLGRTFYNPVSYAIKLNSSAIEEDPAPNIDITSNGVKIRAGAGVGINDAGSTYIFAILSRFSIGATNVAPSPAR